MPTRQYQIITSLLEAIFFALLSLNDLLPDVARVALGGLASGMLCLSALLLAMKYGCEAG